MSKFLYAALLTLITSVLFAQQAAGCFELVNGGNGRAELRFNVASTTPNSNSGAYNRMSRGEVTLSWTGPGEVVGFVNGEYSWVNDGSTDNSVQYRFGPVNQITTFNEGESILLLTLEMSENAGTLNISSSDLINLLNVNLATDNTCSTSLELGALPVMISSFTAHVVSKTQAQLTWNTANESNNSYFGIEHSTDGTAFTEVGQIDGNGTIDEASSYQFRHTTPEIGTNYYRLRQVDYDGTATYSAIQSIIISGGEVGQVHLFPNPATSEIRIVLPDNTDGTRIQLFDQVGRLHSTAEVGLGTLRTKINVTHLPRGLYWIQIKDKRSTSKQQVILH